MSEFWLGVMIGTWLGGALGFVFAALMAANKRNNGWGDEP